MIKINMVIDLRANFEESMYIRLEEEEEKRKNKKKRMQYNQPST